MALAHQSKLFGVNEAAVYKLVTDPAGAPPTYGTKVTVVGAKSLTAQLAMDLKQLRGDNTLLAADAIFKEIKGDLKYAKFNFDIIAAATSGTAADSGTTPSQKTVLSLAQSDLPAYIKMEARSKQVDYVAGDIHFTLWKAMPQALDWFGFDEENYNNQGIGYTAVPLIGTPTGFPASTWITATANETQLAIV